MTDNDAYSAHPEAAGESYPLSPIQEGLLFHSLYSEHPGTYVTRVVGTLREKIDPSAFERAWQCVLDRHDILRTSFHWRDPENVRQIVHPHVKLPFETHDWRDTPEAEWQGRLEAYLEADQRRGFDPSEPPLMRLALIRMGDDRWRFVWTFHHLLHDGTSFPVILREVFEFHEAFLRGASPRLPPPRQYREYIDWLRRRDPSLSRPYWTKRLKGLVEPSLRIAGEAVTDVVNLEEPAGVRRITLSKASTSKLEKFARRHDLTLSTLVQGAWGILLGRYGGGDDVLFGSVRSCRRWAGPDAMSIVGPYINTLPVRVEVSRGARVLPWLNGLRSQWTDMREHEHVPLAKIHEWSDVPMGAPMFTSLVLFEPALLDTIMREAGGAWERRHFRVVPWSHYPLAVTAFGESEFRLTIQYNRSRFSEGFIDRMLGHMKVLLEGLVADPDRPVSDVPMLSDSERRILTEEWSGEGVEYERGACVHELFEECALSSPDAVAVVCEGEHLTYGELDRRADRLSLVLRGMGVGPEVRVGICVERSARMVMGLLGILKAGGAYVPLDPGYPSERLRFMLEDAGVGVVVTESGLEGLLPADGLRFVYLDGGGGSGEFSAGDDGPVWGADAGFDEAGGEGGEPVGGSGQARRASDGFSAGEPRRHAELDSETVPGGRSASDEAESEGLDERASYEGAGERGAGEGVGVGGAGVTSDNTAYVIYTSGSLGKPKGVLVSHYNVVRLFESTEGHFGFDESDVWSLFHSCAFDFSVWEIWGSLTRGGRLVVVPYWVSRSAEAFYELAMRERVTVLNQTPSAFRQYIWAEGEAGAEGEDWDSALRLVIFGGEALDVGGLRGWYERHGDERPRLVNMYGITETTVHVTYRRLRGRDFEVGPGSVIGRPMSDLRLYILDENGRVVPVGVPGEMYVGGGGVSGGYLGRSDLTAERFVPDFMGGVSGSVLYRTGDLGRYLKGGDIEYLGRVDDQVQIRGFRVEPGEVESVLREHPRVRECAVVSREEVGGERRLVGYVVSEGEEFPAVGDLRGYLSDRLPEHMVPGAYVMLEEIPRTPSGKVDRRGLPAPDERRPELGEEYAAPRTEAEERLCGVWSEVLGIDRVGINDNFFALGGDSIRSIRVLALAKRRGLEFSIQQLFEHPTVAELAMRLKRTDEGPSATVQSEPFSLISGEDRERIPEDIEDAYPPAALQAGMLFHSEYSPETAVYHDVFSYHLKIPFRSRAFQEVLGELTAGHAPLRTSFHMSGFSEPLQLVHREVEAPFRVEDLRHLASDEQDAAIDDWIEAEKKRSFDVSVPPLIRFCVHRRTSETIDLSLSFHHAILDGWSVASLLTELLQRYMSVIDGKDRYVAPPPTFHFRDFVALEREAVESEECRRYWGRVLDDLTVKELPRLPERSAPAEPGELGTVERALPDDLTGGLRDLAESAGVPLKSVFLAAHLSVLNTLFGASDVLTGLVSNGRPEDADGERVLGLFLNTVPFRLKLDGGEWPDLLRETFRAEREMLPFRRYPLAELQRSFGGRPLFEVAFNYVHFHVYEALSGVEGLEVLGGRYFERTNFVLLANFMVDVSTSGVKLVLNYDSGEITESQAGDIGGYYLRTLEEMTRSSDSRYELFSPLSDSERRMLTEGWSGEGLEYERGACVHELFEERALSSPDAVAVVCEGEHLTYGELNRRADRLSVRLKGMGVGPEVRVGICVERSARMVMGLLGILKAGGAYVPLDPGYPSERLRFMLEDAGVGVVVTESGLEGLLPADGLRFVHLDGEGGWDGVPDGDACERGAYGVSSERPRGEGGDGSGSSDVDVTPDNTAYVIYTSGSLGKPKGVLVSHHNVVRLFESTEGHFGFDEGDVWSLFHSCAFDFSVWEIWGSLTRGGRLVVVPYWVSRSAEAFYELTMRERVTVLNQTPSAFRQYIWAEGEAGLEDEEWDSALRLVIFGGEALDVGGLGGWYERHGDERPRLVNMYGITETTVHVTYRRLRGRDFEVGSGSVIGRPMSDLRLYILDEHGRVVPVGVPGEMYVGGGGVSGGYLGRSDLTAERFVPDFMGGVSGGVLYRTGDLGRYLEGGDIEYLGRVDDQVQIRGFRVEPGEVESVLREHPRVRECAVVSREEVGGERRLVGYVVSEGEEFPAVGDLRGYLSDRLPEHMVPGAYVMLEEIPRTPSGKVDRRGLPAPDERRPELGEEYAAPRTEAEERLCGVWGEVLGIDRVGINDNFFALGGHSLVATRVVSRLRDAFRVDLPLRILFESPTVAGLAERIEEIRGEERGVRGLRLEPVSREGDLPLSYAQERLWILDQLEAEEHPVYNIPIAVKLKGALDVGALRRAVNEIVRRHEGLRTNFAKVESRPVQIIARDMPVDLPITDMRGMPEPEREAECLRCAREEAERPFDLARDPLLRGGLLRTAEREHVLLLTVHHIVFDAWSIAIFNRELSLLYQAFSSGRPSPPADLPIQYADYSVWQREWLKGRILEEQVAYWKGRLEGMATLELPTDHQRPAVQTYSGAIESLTLSKTLTEELKALSRREGCTMFMTLLAAFKVTLHRHTGQDDIVVGSPIANRNRAEIEGLLGFFVNTLVLRTDVPGDADFREVLSRVKEAVLGAHAHQDLPFERLIEELKPRRDMSRSPLFQVFFNMLNIPRRDLELSGLSAERLKPHAHVSPFDMTLYVGDRDDGIRIDIVYNTDLFISETIAWMLRHFKTLLEGVASDQERPVSELPLLDEATRRRLSGRGNVIRPTNPFVEFKKEDIEQSITERFERQVAMYPGNIAVTTADHEWTYERLNSEADRIAYGILKTCGPGEGRVALLFEHGAQVIAAILGVLKAGKTYVPLDPSYPPERIVYLLEDLDALALATNSANLALAERSCKGAFRIVNVDETGAAGPGEDAGEPAEHAGEPAEDAPGSAEDPGEPAEDEREPSEDTHVSTSPDDVAYILYTSGSTGLPKGVMQSHRNVLHHIQTYTNKLHICPDDRLTLLSPYSFDAAVMGIYGALLNGATLCPLDIKGGGLADLPEWLAEKDVTIYHSTPTVYRYLVGRLTGRREFPRIRLVVLGGEGVYSTDVESYKKHFSPDCVFINGFGPTESTMGLQYWMDKRTDPTRYAVPIGYPVDDTEVLLLDGAGREAEVYGEIALRSPYVALGYWRKPEATREVFLPDPEGGDKRVYRTGDMGRLLPDGGIEFVGRRDLQVKVRGFRIEPGEVETALREHRAVREAVVIAESEEAGEARAEIGAGDRLAAYVVPHRGETVEAVELRSFLQRKLPDYMIPSVLFTIDELPLTASGKVDRGGLRAAGRGPGTAAGAVGFVGVMDGRVTIRGLTVELGEIESALRENEDVKECVVMAFDDDRGGKDLVAYTVCSTPVSPLSLRRYLRERLADHVIPSRFVQLEEIPSTPDGRIDYDLLYSLSGRRRAEADGFVPPRSPMEKKIAEIWKSLLSVEKVGAHDNFFDLGGHSLLAVTVMTRLQEELGIRVPFREFLNQTLGQFAAGCEARLRDKRGA